MTVNEYLMAYLISFLIGYVIVSLIVGLTDLLSLYVQDRDFSTIPQGDIGYYIERKPILGVHNWILFPSWIILGPFIIIAKIQNTFF